MSGVFTNYAELLALANPPASTGSIVDWSPFPGGDSLDTITEKYNDWCYEIQSKILSQAFFEQISEGIRISTVSLANKLDNKTFENTQILVIDSKAFTENDPRLDELTVMMSITSGNWKKATDRPYVTEISPDPSTRPLGRLFPALPVRWSEPRVLSKQRLFEEFLRGRFQYAFNPSIVTRVDPGDPGSPPPGGPNPSFELDRRLDDQTREYFRIQLPEIVQNLREEALKETLESEEIDSRLQVQVATEAAVASIMSKMHDLTNLPIKIEPVRAALANIYQQPFDFNLEVQPVELVGVKLNRPLKDLTRSQRKFASRLELAKPEAVTIQIDQPQVWETIAHLGDRVQTIRIKTELPLTPGAGGKLKALE